MKYVIICKLKNGSTIPAFAETFNSAMHIAEMFTKRVEIVKISTGATTRYIY